MHGDWDGQTETWDSLAEEYKWDITEYRDIVSLGFRSGLAAPTPETSFELFSRLGTTSGFTIGSESSVFNETKTFNCGAKVAGWFNSITGFETVSLGAKSGVGYLEYPLVMNSYGLLGMGSQLEAEQNTNVTLKASFSTGTSMKSNSEGSIFDEAKTFELGSEVSSWVNSLTGFETVSLGAKSSVGYLEFRLFIYSYGLLGMKSLLGAESNTNVTLSTAFSTGTSMKPNSAGSTFNQSSELKMRTRMSPDGSNSILRDACLFAFESGLEDAQNIVNFYGEGSLGMKASVWGLGVNTLNLFGSLGMAVDLFAASGNTFFASCVFNGVMSDEYTVNYTARDVAFLGTSIGAVETSQMKFHLEHSFSMGMSYTARDGWWIRPLDGVSSEWSSDNNVSGDWTADLEGTGSGWVSDEY